MKAISATVISDKMQKSAVVAVNLTRSHPLYGKILKKTSMLHVENLIGAKTGDRVEILPTRKISKTKSHKIIKILDKN